MKKALPIVAVVLLLIVVGFFLKGTKKPETSLLNKPEGNVFNSIKDALSKSLSLKCVYKDEQGVQTTTYIKGGAVRVIMEGIKDKEQPNTIIMKDKKMYMWNEISKTGFTYTITEPKVTPSQGTGKLPETTGDKNESVLAEIEKYKDSCKTEVISDTFFAVPTDVKFQDMSKFTENLMKQVPTDESTGDQQKYLEELMKQVTPGTGDEQ